jgi:raffinose/stachyose/melibiose transport system substrate-binding protein
MKRTRTRILMAAVAICFALTGIGFAQSKGDVKIKVYTRWSGDEPLSAFFRQKVKDFNAQKKGIYVESEAIGSEDSYLDKLRTGFATGTPPNVFVEYGGSRIVDYVSSGSLVDLKPYLDKDPKWRDAFLPLFDSWQYKEYPGTYGIPVVFYAVELYYNKEIFAKVGVQPPKTLDDFRAVSEKILKAGYIPCQIGEKDSWRGGHLLNNLVIKSFGAEGVAKLADRSLAYDSPEMVKLYAIIKEFNDKGYFGKNAVGVDNNAENTSFETGKSAMIYNGSWYLGNLTQSKILDKVGVVPFPSINPKFSDSVQGGAADGFSVAKVKDQAQIDASVEFIKYVSNAEYFKGLEQVNKGGIYPVKFDSDPSVANALTIQFKDNLKNVKEFRSDIQNYDSASHMLETVRLAIQGLFIGKTPAQCGKEIVDKIKANE